jgi:helix-turn-helix protein
MSLLAENASAVVRAHHKPRREKMFGEGRLLPLDRNAKARIMVLARALMQRSGEGKHYGVLTAKFVAVLGALLWGFHNAKSGRCFPSYERIAEKADCARSTVYEAIRALEDAGILTWVNRIARIRDWGPDLFGKAKNRWRVIRTSNQYCFVDPQPPARPADSSKFEFQTGTEDQESSLLPTPALNPENPLHRALARLGEGVRSEKGAALTAPRRSLAG